MPRRTRRQLVGKQEDAERQLREEELRALELELHQQQKENADGGSSEIIEPTADITHLFQAKIRPLTVPA